MPWQTSCRTPRIARWRLEVRDADGREQWSSFHPAPGAGERYGLAEDGSVYAGGHTASTDFPVTAGAYQTDHGGVGAA